MRHLGIEVDDAIEIAEEIYLWSPGAAPPTPDVGGGACCAPIEVIR